MSDPRFYYAFGDGLSVVAAPLFGNPLAHALGTVPTVLAEDASFITSVLRRQLEAATPLSTPGVVTVTAGMNDILRVWSLRPHERRLREEIRELAGLHRSMVHLILKRLPCATVIVSTVPDPTHATGELPGVFGTSSRPPFPIAAVAQFNEMVKAAAAEEERVAVADLELALLHRKWFDTKLYLRANAHGANAIACCWKDAYTSAVATV